MHIPRDERSEFDVKTRQCVFIEYGQNQLGYRFYDLVQKRLVRCCDAVFVEDETIEDIENVQKRVDRSDGYLIDLQFILPTVMRRQVRDDDQSETCHAPLLELMMEFMMISYQFLRVLQF